MSDETHFSQKEITVLFAESIESLGFSYIASEESGTASMERFIKRTPSGNIVFLIEFSHAILEDESIRPIVFSNHISLILIPNGMQTMGPRKIIRLYFNFDKNYVKPAVVCSKHLIDNLLLIFSKIRPGYNFVFLPKENSGSFVFKPIDYDLKMNNIDITISETDGLVIN